MGIVDLELWDSASSSSFSFSLSYTFDFKSYYLLYHYLKIVVKLN